MESLTRPLFHHRRKLSTASSSNGLSFSGKDEYEDLLSDGNKKTKFRRGVVVEDYAEIFGGGAAGGRRSSIPVLDLSDLDRQNGELRSSNGQLDYFRIFGGLAGGDGGGASAAVPPYEELFGGANKSKCDKAKPRATADVGSPIKSSDNLKDSDHGRGCLSEASNKIFESAKQLNMSYHKTSQLGKDGSNGTTHIAQLNAVPGFTCFVNGDTQLQKQDHDNAMPPTKTATYDKRSTSDELPDGKSGRRAKWKLQNAQASEGVPNGKGDTERNLSGVNRRLFYSGEMDVKSLKVPLPSSSAIDRSRPNGKLFYSGELDLKSRPSKVPPPSSSYAQINNNRVHLNQSKSFAFGSKVDSSEKDTGGYFTPSDEELDVDSAAAVSAAALKKAIQQAQESIRLAKELMERKHDPMKSRSRSSVKVKDVKEAKHDQHVTCVVEKNMKDASKVVDAEVADCLEFNKNNVRGNVEVNSAIKDGEALSANRKIEAQKPEEIAEAVEGGGMSSWFTQLLNNGKNRMAAFASQLVDNKNSTILPEKSEKVEDSEMTKPAVETLEKNNPEKHETVARLFDPEDAEREQSTVDRRTELDKNSDLSDSDACVKECNLNTQVDVATGKMQNKFEDGGESEKKLGDCPEMKDDKKFQSEKCEKDHPVKNFIKLSASKDEAEMVFKLEKEEILDAVCGLEENESTVGAVDTRRNLGEFCQVVDNEGQRKAATGNESDEKKLEDVAEIRLECYSQHETDEQMPLRCHDGVVNHILSKEECLQEGLNQTTTNKHEYEVTDLGHRDDIEIIENQEIDATKELKEKDYAEADMDEGRESSKIGAWPEHANRNLLNSPFDSCDTEYINMPIENFELCGITMNICNERVSQLEVWSSVKDNFLAGNEEQACEPEDRVSEGNDELEPEEDENEVAQAVEGAFMLEESELRKTSYLNQNNVEGDVLDSIGSDNEGDDECEEDEKQVEDAVESEYYAASYLDRNDEEGDVVETVERENEVIDDQINFQEDVLETIIQDFTEALASDDETDNFGSATTTHEEIMSEAKLPTEVYLLKTSAFIPIDPEEDVIENDRNKDKPPPEKSPLNFAFTDMKVRIQIEEKDDLPHSVVGAEHAAQLVHDNDGCVEDIMGDINNVSKKEGEKDNNVKDHQERDLVEKNEESNSPMPSKYEGCQEHLETDSGMETGESMECSEENFNRTERESVETREAVQKETEKNEYLKKIEVVKRERERQKDRIAVERAIREARERALAEARERAERAAVEKANAEARQRAIAGAREKLGKVPPLTKSADKASSGSKIKAERAAVERATAEARERALEKALSQKNGEARAPGGKVGAETSPSVSINPGIKHSLSSPDLEIFDENNNESAQRRKARLERHQRIMERAAKALAEKNMRDVLAQREQAERNRLADTLDAEIKRWASGKEGNLRALLSTLQYILGANSGWQPITLTEIITTSAVKKAYRRATLYVHPDKLQQRGASIQQKYICEKVFDLLKAAWNKFNSEER